MPKNSIRSFRNLQVYQLAFRCSVDLYDLTQTFPEDSNTNLAQKLLTTSRAVCAHIAAAWGKRRHRTNLISHLSTAQLETTEVQIWIEAAIAAGYLGPDTGQDLCDRYRYLAAALDQLMANASLGTKRWEESDGEALPATA